MYETISVLSDSIFSLEYDVIFLVSGSAGDFSLAELFKNGME